LARDGAQVSATTAARQAADPAARLQAASDMYYDALGAAAENRLGVGARDRLDAIADDVIPQLSQREAWPVLRRNLSILALRAVDPRELLTEALAKGSVDDAADPAAVLDHRIDPAGTHSAGIGVLRWLPAIPAALADDPHWGTYLARREELVEGLADEIRERARAWTNATAPAWARPLITVNPILTAEIAVFRACTGVAEADTRITGARQFPVRTRGVQAALQRQAAANIGRHSADTTRWNDLIDAIHPRLRSDAYWPQLAAKLADAARATPDLRQIIITAAQLKPLPDEQPAAALWWRIIGAITPSTTVATLHSRLRPPWITDLDAVFGTALAETIAADLAWPGLVAAINAADPNTWTPRDLLHLAVEHLNDDLDQGHSVAPGDYARLITYTVDAYSHRLHAHLGGDLHDIPAPQEAPPDPDDEALFPPDPEHPDTHAPFDHIDTGQPTEQPGLHYDEGLRFDELRTIRPPRELPITMELFMKQGEEYRTVCHTIDTLRSEVAAGNGPAVRAAADDLLRMRHHIDADRPYAHAVLEAMAQWSDADANYDESLLLVEHARKRLATLQSDPDAEELDIASARQQITFYTDLLPDQPPSLQFEKALGGAQAARAAAAGGHIVREADLIAARGDAELADLATLSALRARRQTLQHRLTRAEKEIAGAFASAQIRAADTLEQMLDSAHSEVALLQSARHLNTTRAPLAIPESALTEHNPVIGTQLTALAAQPYRLGYAYADSSDLDTIAALQTLRAAANANGRNVLWLAATEDAATTARDADLAGIAITIDYHDLAEQLWLLGPEPMVIIDNPAATDPQHLATITSHITSNHARAIILDPADGTTGPASPALQLLANTLPWTVKLTATQTGPLDRRGTLTPAITIADRLGRPHLNQPWQRLLTHYDTATRAIHTAHRLHRTLCWNERSRGELHQSRGASIDD
jgi:hypothetical protein